MNSRVSRLNVPATWAVPLLTLLGLWLRPALAQTTGSQHQFEGSNGIKVGEGRLHPYFDLELRFDSAAGFFNTTGTALELKPEAVTHFRPGLKLDVPGQSVALNLDGNVDYLWYTGLLTSGSSSASRLQAAADASALFNPGGNLELDLSDHFARSDRTHNTALGVGVLSLFNEALAAIPIRPGGRALEIVPAVGFSFENFKSISGAPVPGCSDITCDPAQVGAMNYQNLRFNLDARWRFLPKTAFTLNSQLDSRSYSAGTSGNPPATLLKASVGLAGLISTKVATVARVGWGHDLQSSGAHTLIGQLEFNYLVNELSHVKFGYLRNLEPVPTFGIYGDDRAYLETRFFLSGRMTFRGYAAFDYLTFYSNSGRKDSNATLDLGPEYQLTPWLIGAVGYVLNARASNLSNAASVNFTRHEAYVRATFIY